MKAILTMSWEKSQENLRKNIYESTNQIRFRLTNNDTIRYYLFKVAAHFCDDERHRQNNVINKDN